MALGQFITLEGGEGSGKSTQARLLEQRLRDNGLEVTMTREPGGSLFGEHLRNVLLDSKTPEHSALSEALLFYAARADHLENKIRPALAAGRWVVCDRFSDSTRAYQGYAGALQLEAIDTMDQLVVAPTFPDLTVIIDIDPAIGMARADQRRAERDGSNTTRRDRFEGRDRTFHDALRQGFLTIAANNPGRCVVIDGSSDADSIGAQIWQVVATRLLQEAGT